MTRLDTLALQAAAACAATIRAESLAIEYSIKLQEGTDRLNNGLRWDAAVSALRIAKARHLEAVAAFRAELEKLSDIEKV